ncbi:MAG: hypothetical protein ACLFQP_00640 [Halothece sp.]
MSYYTLKECLQLPPWRWNWDEIKQLSNTEIEALCKVMGIASSGSKSQKIFRLKSVAEVRLFLNGKDLKTLQNLPKKVLVEKAKKVGVIHYLTKYAIAASLLNWRKSCNSRGMNYVKQIVSLNQANPKQLNLDLFHQL